MNTKQVKQGVLAALLGLSLAFVLMDQKSSTATANDDNHPGAVVTPAGVNLASLPEFALPDARELAGAVGGDRRQDKPAAPQDKTAQDKPAEEVYKNIQVLKGVPAGRLMGAMNFFAKSLGVKCDHCHVPGAFEKDDKPEKQTARKMYEMVRVSNKELGNNRVSCFMCHRGKVQPEQAPEEWGAQAAELMKNPDRDKRPSQEVYKNVQVLKGVPAWRWALIMQMFSKSLGVKCDHCHVPGAFEKDDKPAKQMARKMLGMVGVISKEIYKGPTSVACYTCHKGQVEPVSFPPPAAKTQ